MNEKEMRELDAWIAEHVMGWKRVKSEDRGKGALAFKKADCCILWVGKERKAESYECDHPEAEMWKPTTNPADAFEVLKKCQHITDVVIYKTVQDKHGVRDDISDMAVDAETIELAIALFAKRLFTK